MSVNMFDYIYFFIYVVDKIIERNFEKKSDLRTNAISIICDLYFVFFLAKTKLKKKKSFEIALTSICISQLNFYSAKIPRGNEFWSR